MLTHLCNFNDSNHSRYFVDVARIERLSALIKRLKDNPPCVPSRLNVYGEIAFPVAMQAMKAKLSLNDDILKNKGALKRLHPCKQLSSHQFVSTEQLLCRLETSALIGDFLRRILYLQQSSSLLLAILPIR